MIAVAEKQPYSDDYSYCEGLLRRNDQDRWLASLFLPQGRRRHVHALYAFSLEIARINEAVSEPLLGEIRFRWWRDVLEGDNAGDAIANPVAAALLDTIARFKLPKTPLLELIGARVRDVYGDRMGSTKELESYTEASCSNLFRLATHILDGDEAVAGLGVAGHAGIAYGIIGLMRALPWHCARGQVFVPADILQANKVEPGDLAAGHASPAVLAALADLRAVARGHLDTFDARLHSLPDKSKPAFLPLCLCEHYLQLMEKPGYDPFSSVVELPQWRRQLILWGASRRWG
ncbi:MAG: squalene/phytoene synthase family protein [Beijerinckiaceae bacterium]|nr:squalene/phytoene synthase family protein [Beijerinckiaceae bacterium]MCI0737387.1 squalene/phytoene synthase family protein [Beijerinckiaceae bacterium]